MNEFQGKIALITGGARGIGGTIATSLAQHGANIIIADILEEVGKQKVSELKEYTESVDFLKLDVTSETDWNANKDWIEQKYGRLDVLVNSAGIIGHGGIEDVSYADFQKLHNINTGGTFLGMKSMLPLLKKRNDKNPQASVVNISSIAAMIGVTSGLHYASSKAATLSLTKSVALEWANKNYNIRVNSIHPGSVQTDMSNGTYDMLMKNGMSREEAVNTMAKLHPLGRLGTLEDMAEAVLFLASDKASFITGTSLVVDGGRIVG